MTNEIMAASNVVENNGLLTTGQLAQQLKISEWENYSQAGIRYFQYSITKTEYEKSKNQGNKGTYKNVFSISLNRKEDIIDIKYLLKQKPKEELTFGSYSMQKDRMNTRETKYILTKSFEDRNTHEIKRQTANINPHEILILEELIEYFIHNVLITKTANKEEHNTNEYDNSSFSDSFDNSSSGQDGGSNDNADDNSDDGGFNDKTIDDEIPF
jgi:hypothetical protein